MSRDTQKKKLLEHLQKNGTITSLQAVLNYNILRPSNRIQELKQDGLNIDTEIIWNTKDDGTTTHYAKYTLLEA